MRLEVTELLPDRRYGSGMNLIIPEGITTLTRHLTGDEILRSESKRIVLGKGQLVIEHQGISKVHAYFDYDGRTINYKDNGSTNGTFIKIGREIKAMAPQRIYTMYPGTSLYLLQDTSKPTDYAFRITGIE